MVLAPEDAEVTRIEEVMKTIKCLGKVRVRGRMFNAKVAKVMVLCECRKSFCPESVPPEGLPVDGQEAWTVVVAGKQEAFMEDFNSKLRAVLRAGGRRNGFCCRSALHLLSLSLNLCPLLKPFSEW